MTASVRVGDGLPKPATHETGTGRAPRTFTEPGTSTATPAPRQAGVTVPADGSAPGSAKAFDDLYARLEASCCEHTGLTPAQLAAHVAGVGRIVKKAKGGSPVVRGDEHMTYLGYRLHLTPHSIRVYPPEGRRVLLGDFNGMGSARKFVRDLRRAGRAPV